MDEFEIDDIGDPSIDEALNSDDWIGACFNCGETGHNYRFCKLKRDKNKISSEREKYVLFNRRLLENSEYGQKHSSTCFNCGETGHKLQHCIIKRSQGNIDAARKRHENFNRRWHKEDDSECVYELKPLHIFDNKVKNAMTKTTVANECINDRREFLVPFVDNREIPKLENFAVGISPYVFAAPQLQSGLADKIKEILRNFKRDENVSKELSNISVGNGTSINIEFESEYLNFVGRKLDFVLEKYGLKDVKIATKGRSFTFKAVAKDDDSAEKCRSLLVIKKEFILLPEDALNKLVDGKASHIKKIISDADLINIGEHGTDKIFLVGNKKAIDEAKKMIFDCCK